MLLWPRKNGLTSLFKEVRVFKGLSFSLSLLWTPQGRMLELQTPSCSAEYEHVSSRGGPYGGGGLKCREESLSFLSLFL